MSIGVTEEHSALAESVRGLLEDRGAADVARRIVDDGADPWALPFWEELAGQGLLGLHVAEEHGGAGYDLVELGVVLEEAGRGLLPGAFVPTVLAGAVLREADLPGGATPTTVLRGLADGTRRGAVALRPALEASTVEDGALVVSGGVEGVLGAPGADVVVLGAEGEEGEVWFLATAEEVVRESLDSVDATRPVGRVCLDEVEIGADRRLRGVDAGLVRELAAIVLSAEATGIAGWCLDTAVEHARTREQFGRPIGQFQAIKHLCADMLVAVEQARATAWDAARAGSDPKERELAAAVAAAVSLDAAVDCAKDCIQILGGIGYTWEHDAHLYLKRATSVRQLLEHTWAWRTRAADVAVAGRRRSLELDLPEEDLAPIREEVRSFAASVRDLEADDRRRRIADEGYIAPHWPEPWGRDAGPAEQIVIDQEFSAAGVDRPDLIIGNWALPTIIRHGTEEQQERFVRPTLHGEITWCQMFSEPGAGSDLASLSTRAERTEGGFLLTGQKIWTSLAQEADWAICLARTTTDGSKHHGITYFLVDMDAEGLDIRPLVELTGRAAFNEVFLDDVFVPDENVVGEVDEGWPLARTTLANERVAMSSGSTMGRGVEGVLAAVAASPQAEDPRVRERVGALVCEGQALSLLGFRTTLRQLSGVEPGASSSVRKLVGMHHAQDCSELVLQLQGIGGATVEGSSGSAVESFLRTRALSIAGGTTQIQRNIVGERILGLPRDDRD